MRRTIRESATSSAVPTPDASTNTNWVVRERGTGRLDDLLLPSPRLQHGWLFRYSPTPTRRRKPQHGSQRADGAHGHGRLPSQINCLDDTTTKRTTTSSARLIRRSLHPDRLDNHQRGVVREHGMAASRPITSRPRLQHVCYPDTQPRSAATLLRQHAPTAPRASRHGRLPPPGQPEWTDTTNETNYYIAARPHPPFLTQIASTTTNVRRTRDGLRLHDLYSRVRAYTRLAIPDTQPRRTATHAGRRPSAQGLTATASPP